MITAILALCIVAGFTTGRALYGFTFTRSR
jgi:hypothetical protein